MLHHRVAGLLSAGFLVVGLAACTQLSRVTLPGIDSVAGSALPSQEPSMDGVLPGQVGSGDSPVPIETLLPGPIQPTYPLETPSPELSSGPATPSPSVPSSTPSPVGPYGGLEATDLVIEPSTLAIGVKTPSAITPVLPDTGVLTATVILRGGGRSSRVTWKSASPGVLSVDENGVCRALDERQQRVQVTATTLDGRLERIVFVELKDRAQVEVVLDDTGEP